MRGFDSHPDLKKIRFCPDGGMVYTRHLKCLAARLAGSNPAPGTSMKKTPHGRLFDNCEKLPYNKIRTLHHGSEVNV